MDGMTAVYMLISFSLSLIALAAIVVVIAFRQGTVMRGLIEQYGDAMTQVAKDALIQSKARDSEEAMRSMSAAAYERESLKQQIEDHKAWRHQVIHDNNTDTPIDEQLPDGKLRLDDGHEYTVRDRDGHKILVNESGEEFDILAGA